MSKTLPMRINTSDLIIPSNRRCKDALTFTTKNSPTLNHNIFLDKVNFSKPYGGDQFLGHLATPITASGFTKYYLNLLPAYRPGLSPLSRGTYIGFAHGYFLFGPFSTLGPLRNTPLGDLAGFISTLCLIIILAACLLIYGLATFSNESTIGSSQNDNLNFLNPEGWSQFRNGFVIGGFSGATLAYGLMSLLTLVANN